MFANQILICSTTLLAAVCPIRARASIRGCEDSVRPLSDFYEIKLIEGTGTPNNAGMLSAETDVTAALRLDTCSNSKTNMLYAHIDLTQDPRVVDPKKAHVLRIQRRNASSAYDPDKLNPTKLLTLGWAYKTQRGVPAAPTESQEILIQGFPDFSQIFIPAESNLTGLVFALFYVGNAVTASLEPEDKTATAPHRKFFVDIASDYFMRHRRLDKPCEAAKIRAQLTIPEDSVLDVKHVADPRTYPALTCCNFEELQRLLEKTRSSCHCVPKKQLCKIAAIAVCEEIRKHFYRLCSPRQRNERKCKPTVCLARYSTFVGACIKVAARCIQKPSVVLPICNVPGECKDQFAALCAVVVAISVRISYTVSHLRSVCSAVDTTFSCMPGSDAFMFGSLRESCVLFGMDHADAAVICGSYRPNMVYITGYIRTPYTVSVGPVEDLEVISDVEIVCEPLEDDEEKKKKKEEEERKKEEEKKKRSFVSKYKWYIAVPSGVVLLIGMVYLFAM